MHVLGFSSELQNAETFVTYSPSNFEKFSKQIMKLPVVESFFCRVIGGWIGQFELFKRKAAKDAFSMILQNFHNSSFSNIPSKIYDGCFFRSA